MQKKSKIDVYLTPEHKAIIQEKAKKLDLSVSDYMKLKALNILKNEEEK
ncbi:hypothetical protein J4401_06955 [Candidatus Woesearchaeota archaeon]|nr:hypothetical protein [Candidatus Woesearchaeota archaeon]